MTGTITNSVESPAFTDLASSFPLCTKRALEMPVNEDKADLEGHSSNGKSASKESAERTKRPRTSGKQKKTVGFAPETMPAELPEKALGATLPNFCTNSNFCTQVRHLINTGRGDGHPLGYLDSRGCAKTSSISTARDT